MLQIIYLTHSFYTEITENDCFQAVANMGIGLGQMYKEPHLYNMCETLQKNATWGYRLASVNVRYFQCYYRDSNLLDFILEKKQNTGLVCSCIK